jgi:putative hydrolase of the HAD superfamily
VPFLKAISDLGITPGDSVYVGDNPALDFAGAKTAGLRTVRLLRGEFCAKPKNDSIDHEIKNLRELSVIFTESIDGIKR